MINNTQYPFRHGVALRDFIKEPLQVLSMGGGTQSTAMLLLVKEGKLCAPDIVLHADTGSELPETVDFIGNKIELLCAELNIPFAIVKSHRGNLHDYYMSKRALPMIGTRSCTMDFKIAPQRRFVREIVGSGNGKKLCDFWLGITTDEEGRSLIKKKSDPNFGKRRLVSDVKWSGVKYPLLDEFPMSREECISLNTLMDFEVGKSGCFMCPYMGVKSHLNVKQKYPQLFRISLEMESLQRARRTEEGKSLGWGLCKESSLFDIDNLPSSQLEDSNCDNDGGCFL